MIGHTEAEILELYAHHIGRKSDQEGYKLTDKKIPLVGDVLHESLRQYFFDSFKEPEYYTFQFSNGDHTMNPMFQWCKGLFSGEELLDHSVSIAKYLYDHSSHPNIKSGDLMIAMVQDVLIEDELTQAICIFKSENKAPFIKMNYSTGEYELKVDEGIQLDKLDKACVIFNTDEENGYRICALDRSNREKDAQFWMQDFLNIRPLSDTYHQTKNTIQATKQFIKDRVKPLYDIDKADEAYILQRSKEYLQGEETFERGSYSRKVFQEEALVEEFKDFQEEFNKERNIKTQDQFSINLTAVKNQSRVFKSVLKLDKNFHVYIHGNRSMIEKGVDDAGRKYYKLYYEEER
ncbi:MAG: nucleoid-associated protein [Saprospiraceae bacterium]|nr:nucleoid-associated protein [Saprospiraceae bacterium]